MAIQISEKHLSPDAKRALANAKSKSQFLRDAIEFYVSNRQEGSMTGVKEDLEEIKELLYQFQKNGLNVTQEIAITKQDHKMPNKAVSEEKGTKQVTSSAKQETKIAKSVTTENDVKLKDTVLGSIKQFKFN